VRFQLNRRERWGVTVAAVALSLFAMIQWVISPYLVKVDRLTTTARAKESALGEMQGLRAQYTQLETTSAQTERQLARRAPNFSLFTYLDNLAGASKIKRRIAYMRPSVRESKDSPYQISSVEMKLAGISLDELRIYLYRVETSEPTVIIKRATISRSGKKKGLLEATLLVETVLRS
jgi:general secretion pathway protein M